LLRRLDELQAMGLCLRDARNVATGRADLNEILQRMAVQDRANQLVEKHGLKRALAVQIAMGHADLAHILGRQRLETYMAEHGAKTFFDARLASGIPVCLALHGRRNVVVRIAGVSKYEFDAMDPEKGTVEHIHKLQVKMAWSPDDRKAVRKVMTWDKERSKLTVEPLFRPQDRYHCSDRRLFDLMEAGTRVTVTTLEGEQVTGPVRWLSEFEFGIDLKGGGEVIVMRHAIAELA